MANKRCTQIVFPSLFARQASRPGQDEQASVPTVPEPIAVIPTTADKVRSHRRGPAHVAGASSLTRFPIRVDDKIVRASPWETYSEGFALRLGPDFRITVAQPKNSSSGGGKVTFRELGGAKAVEQLRMLQRIRHANFVSVLRIFQHNHTFHVMSEYMPVSLEEIARSRRRVGKVELADILGQLVDGLTYLSAQCLSHGSLRAATVLVNEQGEVKIAASEKCTVNATEHPRSPDVEAFTGIVAKLMREEVTETGIVRVTGPDMWDEDVLKFVSKTTAATSMEELVDDPLLQSPRRLWQLQELVSITIYSARFHLY
ncbi:hypothetical protein T440DRAFT_473339, partial [Plenodomus tracheiphilus IPT5]